MMRVVDEGIMIILKALHLHRRFYWIPKPVNPTTLDSIVWITTNMSCIN